MKSGWLSMGVLLMAGCTTAQVQATRQIPTLIEPHDSVAIVVSHDATDGASDAVGCISKALKETFQNLRIVLPDEFHKAAFPDVALETAPRALIYLPLLQNDPAFHARIAPLRLRYLISIQGKTEQQAKPIAGGIIGHKGDTILYEKSYDYSRQYKPFSVPIARSRFEENFNAALSDMMSQLLADLELLAKLKL